MHNGEDEIEDRRMEKEVWEKELSDLLWWGFCRFTKGKKNPCSRFCCQRKENRLFLFLFLFPFELKSILLNGILKINGKLVVNTSFFIFF